MSWILLVEDSLTETAIISRCLQQAGLRVVSVTSVEDAQSRLDTEKPGLIIADVILPGQSGFEFCQNLKADPATQQIPVVLCSIKNTAVDKLWGDMLGANAYLNKPVNEQELVQVVQRLMTH